MKHTPPRRPRILFVGEYLTISHVRRPWILATQLARTHPEYDVHFACSMNPSLYAETGLSVHHLPGPEPKRLQQRIERVFFPLYTQREIQEMVAAEIDLLARLKPDLVIHDFRNTLAISTHVAHVPLITLTDFYWSAAYTPPLVVPDNPLITLIGQTLAQKLTAFLTPRVEHIHVAPFNAVAAMYGLTSFKNLRHLYTSGAENWLYDIPSIIPFKTTSRIQSIGPVRWEHGGQLPEWLHGIPDHAAICITFASNGDPRHIPPLIKSLRASHTPIIILTAGRIESTPEQGIYCADFLPINAVLKKSKILICGGGSTLAYAALAAQVPVIGIPANITHWYTMKRFEALKLGILIPPHQLTNTRIHTSIATLTTDPAYIAARSALSEELHAHDPHTHVHTYIAHALRPKE